MRGLEDIIKATVKKEMETTDSIKKISYQAMEEMDCVTRDFLIDMIKEQQEEEVTAFNWEDRLEIYKTTNSPLILLDQEMGE